jgi:imidazolonepropionase-like amidohydrolase
MSNVAPEPYLSMARDGGYPQEYEDAIKTIGQLAAAGIKIVSGGDYGHIWQPHGTTAHDLSHFVSAGMSAKDALLAGTYQHGGLSGLPVGQLTPGYYADLLILDGNPTADVTILQDRGARLAVVKGGEFAWINPDRIAGL